MNGWSSISRKLPGIGIKSAQRLAFHILNMPREEAQDFADAILSARETVTRCKICQNLTDRDECVLCSDPARDHSLICVVSDRATSRQSSVRGV